MWFSHLETSFYKVISIATFDYRIAFQKTRWTLVKHQSCHVAPVMWRIIHPDFPLIISILVDKLHVTIPHIFHWTVPNRKLEDQFPIESMVLDLLDSIPRSPQLVPRRFPTVDLRWIYHWKKLLEKSPIQQTRVHRQFVDAKHVG